MTPRTLTIDVHWADSSLRYDGGSTLEINGKTENDVMHKIKLKLSPDGVGYLADQLHAIVKKEQKRLDAAKAQLRGEL